MRAFAVELIFFSFDREKYSQLFKIDPAGHFTGYFATSSGLKDQEAESKLEQSFKDLKGFSKLKKDDLILQCIKVLQNTVGQDFQKTDVEIAFVDNKSQLVTKLSEDEIENYLKTAQRLD